MMLENRTALVTGGESGIGAACVTALAAAGANVAVLYFKDRAKAEVSCGSAEAQGRRSVAVKADVSIEREVEAAFDRTRDELGRPDILVNSAGLNMSGIKVADMATAQWERLIRTDLTGCFFTCRRFVKDLRAAGRPGSIVNVSSIHSGVMRAGGADYDAAKGGLRNLTRTLALETARLGITVNAIAPGMILTPMNERAMVDLAYRKELEASIPVGRAGRAEEVAQAALFLVSPAATYITGSTITIDGGLSLMLGQGA